MNVTSDGWIPARGDYGAHYATDLIPLVEASNCVKGCVRSGTQAARDEFGPGGHCHILAVLGAGADDRIPALVPEPQGIRCTARIDPATAGMDALFPDH